MKIYSQEHRFYIKNILKVKKNWYEVSSPNRWVEVCSLYHEESHYEHVYFLNRYLKLNSTYWKFEAIKLIVLILKETHTTILPLKHKIQTSVHTNCVHFQGRKVVNVFSGGQFDNLYQNNKQNQKLLMYLNLRIYLREVIIKGSSLQCVSQLRLCSNSDCV